MVGEERKQIDFRRIFFPRSQGDNDIQKAWYSLNVPIFFFPVSLLASKKMESSTGYIVFVIFIFMDGKVRKNIRPCDSQKTSVIPQQILSRPSYLYSLF